MEIPPCPTCADCGRLPTPAPFPPARREAWRRHHDLLAIGAITPLQIARCYGRHIEDTIAWLYPNIDQTRRRPLEL